jgi:NADPH:quinone reductase-like Zn-dependent oxidoreductase
MRAAVYRRYGPPEVVRIEEIPTPSPRPGAVLIKVHASTLSAANHRARSRNIPTGLRVPAALSLGGVSGPAPASWAWAPPALSRPWART